MRVIYLTLAAFILLGIGAACRTPPIAVLDCDSAPANSTHCLSANADRTR